MKTLRHLLNLGIDTGQSKKDKARISAINIFGFGVSGLLLVYAIFFIIQGNQRGALIIFAVIVVCLLPPILNYFNYQKAGRYLLNVNSAPAIYYYIFLIGPGLGIEYFMILTFSYPFIFLKKEEKYSIVFFFFYNSIFLLLSEFVPLTFIDPIAIAPEIALFIKFSITVICCIHAGLFYYLFYQSIDLTESELINAKNDAIKASKAKRDFIASMSHEIRTPLNAVVSISKLLSEGNTNDNSDLINSLKFSSDHLMNIINDILDFSKLEAGKISLDMNPIDLKRLISNIKNAYHIIANEKNISIELDIDKTLNKTYLLDELRFTQIIGNLINNAIKFTHEGSVRIVIKKINSTTDKDHIAFSIIDTGIGIPSDRINSIFSSFSQLSSSITKKYGGSGLGLSIVTELLKLFDSRIMVQSTLGKGSEFTFKLLLERVQVSTEKNLNKIVLDLKNQKVLVVEDYQINAMVIKKTLSKWGLQVDIAESGKEAIIKYQKNQYDLVLMDIHMPEMGGMETTKRIKKLKNYQNTPIYALSADITIKEDPDFKNCFEGFLSKPLEHNKIISVLTKHLKVI